MTNEQEEPIIQRILVALDASDHSLAALEAAAELASSLEAELHGLFVEDINLLRIAGLPMARELQFPFARHAHMDPGTMRRQLRAQARQARKAISSTCRQRKIEWTFQVARGSVPSEVLEAATRADLLCVGKASRPVMQRQRTGSTARAAATKARHSVLLISQGAQIQSPVVIPHDGSPHADRALPLACRLAKVTGGFLSILINDDPARPSEEQESRLTKRLEGEDLVVRYRKLTSSGITALIWSVQTARCGILMLSRAVFSGDEITRLLDELTCPVLVMG